MVRALVAFLMIGLCAGLVVGQTTRSGATTRAATGPASPKAALKDLAAAMQAGDAETIRGLLWSQSEPEKELVGAVIEMSQAVAKLRQTAVQVFGPEGAKGLVGNTDLSARADKAIDEAQVEMSGDRATASMSDGTELALANVDGAWRVAVSAVVKGYAPEDLARSIAEVRRWAKLYKDTAAEISEKRYKDAEAAAEALRTRVREVTSQPATTQAATTQSTQPTTGPTTR